MLERIAQMLANRFKPMSGRQYSALIALTAVIAVAAPITGTLGAFDGDNGSRPGMLAPAEQPSGQEPIGEELAVEEPVEIGEPQSALGKAIIAKYGEATFFGNEKAGLHKPEEYFGELGIVQEPLHGDMVYVPWSGDFKVDDTFSITAGEKTYWLTVAVSKPTDGRTVLHVLLPDDEPDTDPATGEVPQGTFTGPTALAALEAAGYGWKAPYPAEGEDIERGLRDWGVTLSASTAPEVTLTFDGGEFVLTRLGETYFL